MRRGPGSASYGRSRMKRALLAINLFLGAATLLVAAFAAREALLLKYGTKEPNEEKPAALSSQAPRSLSDYGVIIQGGLFGKGSLQARQEGPQQAEPTGLVLVGTAEGAGFAIFMDTNTGQQKPFRKGESVFGGGLVSEISTKKAELDFGGRRVLFKVPASMPAVANEPVVKDRQQLVTGRAGGKLTIDQRAVTGLFDNMDQVLTDARFTPYTDEGKLNGFQISEVKPSGVFNVIGLKDGDVVLSINDYKLDSPGKVAQILGGLKGQTEVKVDVLRGKQPRTLKYQIR